MILGAVISLCLAILIGGSGAWALLRRSPSGLTEQVLRSVAPTQLAAAVMLAAGGIAALAAPGRIGTAGLVLGVIGAMGTVAAGSWQGARYAALRESAAGCQSEGGCGSCEKACR